jgi:hypothetical protein
MALTDDTTGDLITPVPFYKSMQELVGNLSCGAHASACDANDWIHAIGWPNVRTELNRGTRVWLYKNRAGDYVGFGSLGLASWHFNQTTFVVQLIPMLGVFEAFQTQPPTESGTPKYCYQIVDHLLDEAMARLQESSWVALSVRPENQKAIAIYKRAGFEWLRNERQLNRMIVKLVK